MDPTIALALTLWLIQGATRRLARALHMIAAERETGLR
jgi:hypothetical protein